MLVQLPESRPHSSLQPAFNSKTPAGPLNVTSLAAPPEDIRDILSPP